jgi:type I restriction enzyme S subunit
MRRAGDAINDGLPEGWVVTTLSHVTENVPNVKPEDDPARVFGYVDISSVCNATNRITDPKRFPGSKAPSRARRPIRPGDVLFSNVRTYLRNVAMVLDRPNVDVCSTGFTVLRSNGAIDAAFLFRYLLTDEFIEKVTPQQTGTHYPATSDRKILAETVPVPPLAEQKRIVAMVEKLLARVNAARERLAKVPAILKRFRQSVLAAACSGRLTADWRDTRPDIEPASDLVAEIRRYRERRYEEECRRAKSAGRRKPKAPVLDYEHWEPDGEIEEVPDAWSVVPVRYVADRTQYGTSAKCDGTDADVPVLRMGNIQEGSLDLTELKYLRPDREDVDSFLLRDGDLLLWTPVEYCSAWRVKSAALMGSG